jgi:hypothetical protein
MAQRQPPTKTGRLSDVARHVVLPSGIVSTGWPAVRDTAAGFGVTFDGWQDGAGRIILAKRADGSYACSIGGAVISIPRQVGKTFLIGTIAFALCLLFPGLTVIWTAHRVRTAGETFKSMQSFARKRKVAPHIADVRLTSGEEAVIFHNGSRVLFGARERGFGRGFAKVGVLVFDEAQILTENAIDDMVPATNTAENPLLIFTGTPPKPSDPSEVFTRKRIDALAGADEDTAYIELSADQGCDPLDRSQWARANPSYPRRTPASAMLRMKKNLSVESFVREGLGVWDDMDLGLVPNWSLLADGDSQIASHRCIGLDVSTDRKRASFGWAGLRADGMVHVGAFDSRGGTAWVLARGVELWAEWKVPLRIQSGSPAAAFIDRFREKGVEVVEVSSTEFAEAVGQLIDYGDAKALRHAAADNLTSAVESAMLRRAGDVDVLARRSLKDITPVAAVCVALGGVPTVREYDVMTSVW